MKCFKLHLKTGAVVKEKLAYEMVLLLLPCIGIGSYKHGTNENKSKGLGCQA
jgi:hypothetical protein